jgi:hypothetical protein
MWFAAGIINCFTILGLVISSALSANSQELAGAKILSSEGTVEIKRPASGSRILNRVKFRPNDPLFVGDLIKTHAASRLIIGLADGSQAIISENTTVEIKDAKNSPRTIFNVLRGKTRIKIEKMGGKPNPYRVTTPTTVIAVRGTIFDVIVKDNETIVYVNEGEVSVANLLFPDREVILTPGQFTTVEKEHPPQNPSPFKPGRNDNSFNSIAEQMRGRGIFGEDSGNGFPGNGNNPGNSGSPGNSGNTPGGKPSGVPANPGNPNRPGRP